MSVDTSTQNPDTATDAPIDPSSETAELETDEKETVDVDHGVPRLSSHLTTVATVVGVAMTAPFNLLAAMFGVSAIIVVAGSMYLRNSRGYLSLGIGLGLFGAIVAGAYGSIPVELMLVGVAALLVSWDVGHHGLSLGRQLGRNTQTKRLELVHAGLTTLVIAVICIVAFVVFQFAGADRPSSAVALVVIGSIVLVWMYRT